MKKFSLVLPALLAAVLAFPAMQASASSVEDVYDAMRRIGLPESMIQEAKIQYQNTEHDANGMAVNGTYYTYDVWADMVEIYQDQIWDQVGAQFGVPGSDIKDSYATATTPTQTTPAPPAQSGSDAPAGSTSTTTTTTATTAFQPSVVTQKPFINMTLDEKKAYVASLPAGERAAFLASLTTSERNSIIKQMSPDDQASIAQGFISLGEQLGMHISVDNIGNGSIDYSIRNEDGTLIDSAGIGSTIDDTGWDLTVPVLLSGGCILLGLGGLGWMTLRMRKEERA